MKKILRKLINQYYQRQGFYGSWGFNWLRAAMEDFRASDLPVKKRLWALKRGFYTYRIAQYNLTEENYRDCLSDREYKRLYPINNRYKIWIDDKLTMKYVLKPFDAYLPKYYYHVLQQRTCPVLRLMDCPAECSGNYSGILELLRGKGSLAVKPSGGTYGIGFCKLSYENGGYLLNEAAKTEAEMLAFFKTLTDHIIMEYVQMHGEIARLNPASLNTVRVMLINPAGNNPFIGSAFMRIGTKQSGLVDNTAQGGMFCKVDVETGRYDGGEKIKNHVITPSLRHPDTGVTVEGVLPHWDLVKTKMIEIANYMPQLEWMGFDIAITPDGFNIIEINSHQGLHRYPTYPQPVKAYLQMLSRNKGRR